MYSWTALALALSFAGCASAPTLPTSASHPVGSLAPSGGPFSASYFGTYTVKRRPCDNTFTFSGTGSATFLSNSSESGTLEQLSALNCIWGGHVILASSLNPTNTITVFMGEKTAYPPCGRVQGWDVLSGTGKFAHASGSGHHKFVCQLNKGTYTDNWNGTLDF